MSVGGGRAVEELGRAERRQLRERCLRRRRRGPEAADGVACAEGPVDLGDGGGGEHADQLGRALLFGGGSVSVPADDGRRGPVSIGGYLKTRLAETFPGLPSDSIQPSAFAVGMPRTVV